MKTEHSGSKEISVPSNSNLLHPDLMPALSICEWAGGQKRETDRAYQSNYLKVIGEFRPSRIPRVHGDKHRTRCIQFNLSALKKQQVSTGTYACGL